MYNRAVDGSHRLRDLVAPAVLLTAAVVMGGCVKRTISITSEPTGALVWLNDREIGRTPVEVEFDYYGTYDVRLQKEGYESKMTTGEAKAPWWEFIGLDLIAELTPADLHSRVEWHYQLRPADDDPAAILERAGELREQLDG